jgi:uncharacterized protein
MPPYEKHLETSTGRTGQDHAAMHGWLDNDPNSKAGRHSLDLLPANRLEVLSSFGQEALNEFFLHIVEDLAMPDIGTLKAQGVPDDAVSHSLEVARKALEISSRIHMPLDRRLIVLGAVYHDLGKAKTTGIQHGEIGARMAESMGLDPRITAIIRKHVRGGLTEKEARELDLPVMDYTLRTPEEKIVIYADRLVDIYTDGIVPGIDEAGAEERFCDILETYEKYGKNPETLLRYKAMDDEIHRWMEGKP